MDFDREQWNRLIREIEQRNEGAQRAQVIEAGVAAGVAGLGALTYGVYKNMPQSKFRGEPSNKKRKMNRVSDDDETMEAAPAALMASAAVAASEGNTAQETPITLVQPTYQLQDTHTTILPITIYFTASGLGPSSEAHTAKCTVNMTGIYDPGSAITWGGALTVAGNTGDAAINPNILSVYNSQPTINNFPRASNTASATAPAGRQFWDNIYEYYTVLACHWELVATNLSSGGYGGTGDAQVAWMYCGNTSVPDATVDQVKYWKNVQYRQIQSMIPGNMDDNTQVIKGSYYPGMYKREVRDDTKAKTWIAKGSNPALQERLHFRFNQTYYGVTPRERTAVACALTLKYVVQWKDLAASYQYPLGPSLFQPGIYTPP